MENKYKWRWNDTDEFWNALDESNTNQNRTQQILDMLDNEELMSEFNLLLRKRKLDKIQKKI